MSTPSRVALTTGLVVIGLGISTLLQTTGGGAPATGCFATPSSCGMPDATNTGIDSGATLTHVTDTSTTGTGWNCTLRTTSPACQALFITGNIGSPTTGLEVDPGISVFIDADNLKIRNLKLDGGAGVSTCVTGSSTGLCFGTPSGHNDSIAHCNLLGDPTGNFSDATAVEFGIVPVSGTESLSIDHCNIHGYAEGINWDSLDGSSVFTNNYVHTPSCWDRTHAMDCNASVAMFGGTIYTDHINAIYTGGNIQADQANSSLLIEHNTLDALTGANCCVSDAIGFFNDSGSDTATNIHGVVIDNLIAAGSGTCINGDDTAAPTYLKFIANDIVSNGSCNAGWVRGSTNWPGIPFTGTGLSSCANYWDDGTYAGSGADTYNAYPGVSPAPPVKQPVTGKGC